MMPTVANEAATLYRVNVPTSTRNSLTKVDSPGSDEPGQAGDQEQAGQQRRDLLHAAVVGDPLRPAPGDHEPGDQEQRAGGEPVVDHVERGAGLALLVIAKMPSTMNPKCETEV